MRAVVYDRVSGEIIYTIEGDEQAIRSQATSSQDVMFFSGAEPNARTHRVSNGTLVGKPAKAPPSPAQALAEARRGMVVYRAGLRKALARIPVPGFEDALALADSIAAHPDTPRAVKIAWQDVIIFERLHPDVQEWGPVLIQQLAPGVDHDAVLDVVWKIAMTIEAGGDPAPALADLLKLI